eukprot:TRINITY_DN18224_c0_g1_i1.p1 TRINITY_DN18224_c0_g1~~TRINITY_DN18224_c0_g1_i1.p1  ORF type:complete len:377 (-),score=50.40 TRINITY_DN18224_c0_g1_i1:129-1184(-)
MAAPVDSSCKGGGRGDSASDTPGCGEIARTVALISAYYVATILGPLGGVAIASVRAPRSAALVAAASVAGWLAFVKLDGCELREGRPNQNRANSWIIRLLRKYFRLSLHNTDSVQERLMSISETGQAIFAVFPHGVNSDFRGLMDGLLYDAFPRVFERASIRSLAASVLFKIPFIRGFCLDTSCVDASRKTAQHVLRKGHSVLVLPGGEEEQVETICGRERVFLKKRYGFLRLAIVHGTPVVPAYVFGCSDVYWTSRLFHGARIWLVRNLHVAVPIYWGLPGFLTYPTPLGFPLPVKQSVVFGEPILFRQNDAPTPEDIAIAHEEFVKALIALFDAEKGRHGYGDRSLEMI